MNQTIQEIEKTVSPSFFLIELTQACNLNCSYCFRGEHQNKRISSKTLDSVLNSIYNYYLNNKKPFSIQAWGGEPTLELNKILYIREYFNNKNIYPSIHVETNGVLLNKDIVMKFLVNDIKFGISIDGFDSVQNLQRPLASKKESFALIRQNICEIHKTFPELKLSCISVITKNSYRYICQILDCLVKDLHFASLKINLVKANSKSPLKVEELNEKEIKWLYRKLFWKVNKLVAQGYEVEEANISIRSSNLFNGDVNDICISQGCMGGYKMIAFDSSGDIYNCELIGDETQKIGTFSDNFIESIEKSIKSGNPYFTKKEDKKCHKCKYKYFCRGGCNSHILNKGCAIDEQMCAVNKTLYPLIKFAKIFSLPICKTFIKEKR